MVTALIKKYIIGIQNCCLCYRSYDFEYRTLISITIANGGIRFHISSLSKGKTQWKYLWEIPKMSQETGSHPCPWPEVISVFNCLRSLGDLISPRAMCYYSWGRVSHRRSLVLSRKKLLVFPWCHLWIKIGLDFWDNFPVDRWGP